MYLTEIPGYLTACRRADLVEDHRRELAFLGITETLHFAGGYKLEVRQLTLRMFVQLCAVRSPFVVGGVIGAQHIAQFLWQISLDYGSKPSWWDKLRRTTPRKRFVKQISVFPYMASVRTIKRYLDRQLMDKPPSRESANDTKPDTSPAASMIHSLAINYGWTSDDILDLPMPRLFQFLRKIHRTLDPEMGFWNPVRDRLTTKVTGRFMERMRENADAS